MNRSRKLSNKEDLFYFVTGLGDSPTSCSSMCY